MTGGSGSGGSATTTALPEEELRDLIEQASRFFDLESGVSPGYFEPAYYPIWESDHLYVVGDVVTPISPNGHIYRVITAGTSAASQPSFPTGTDQTVSDGTVVFMEAGADVVASEKVVYGDGSNYLRMPPYVVGTLDPAISVPDGYAAPAFVERDGYLVLSIDGVLPPFSQFNNCLWPGWYSGVAVTVSAVWGLAATPADVKLAVIELVINLHRETDPASLKLTDLEGQPLRETVPPRVKEIAKRYRARLGGALV